MPNIFKTTPGSMKSFSSRAKYNNVISEFLKPYNYTDDINKKIARAITFIEKNCQQFLEDMEAGQEFLYHGYYDVPKYDIFIGQPRNDRRPMDTSANIQKIVNNYLQIENFVANRANSLFCTSSSVNAGGYTSYKSRTSKTEAIYLIFPIDGFKYTWSMMESDWVITMRDLSPYFNDLKIYTKRFISQLGNIGLSISNTKIYEILSEIANTLDEISRPESEFTYIEHLNLEDECLTKLEEFYNDYQDPIYQTVRDNIKINDIKAARSLIQTMLNDQISAKEFVKMHKILSSRLDTAIKMKHEVLINGQYLAVNKKYLNVFQNYFIH